MVEVEVMPGRAKQKRKARERVKGSMRFRKTVTVFRYNASVKSQIVNLAIQLGQRLSVVLHGRVASPHSHSDPSFALL